MQSGFCLQITVCLVLDRFSSLNMRRCGRRYLGKWGRAQAVPWQALQEFPDWELSFPHALLRACLAHVCSTSPDGSWHLRSGRCLVRYMGGLLAVESSLILINLYAICTMSYTAECVHLGELRLCSWRLVSAYRPVANAGSLVRGQRVAWPV